MLSASILKSIYEFQTWITNVLSGKNYYTYSQISTAKGFMKENSLVGFPLGILNKIEIPKFMKGLVKSMTCSLEEKRVTDSDLFCRKLAILQKWCDENSIESSSVQKIHLISSYLHSAGRNVYE